MAYISIEQFVYMKVLAHRVGCKKLWVLLKYLRSDFVVNVLRTKQYIHRIRSIDIISLWEISDIARRAFISIENETPPSALARRAFISIENETPPSYSIARSASIENEQFLTIMSHFLYPTHQAYISIEQFVYMKGLANMAFTKKRQIEMYPNSQIKIGG